MRRNHDTSAASPAARDLARIRKAQSDGRFQTALDLARQLCKYEPTPAHRDVLKEVTLSRARQLREAGATRDAATVVENALRLDDSDPAWLARVAEEAALCGDLHIGLDLAGRVTDPTLAARLLGGVADAAIEMGERAREYLPEALLGDLDRIRAAFQQVESGQDDDARTTLQGIGLKSPFLEWKLLLRGLQAYYQNDDARALENWQRLSGERLPARLAAPFRAAIEPAYRTVQPAAVQAELQKRFDRLQGSPLATRLAGLRPALAKPKSLAQAFRQVEALLPLLKQEAPHLVPRLAKCFYWATFYSGPDDLPRYRRVFGNPPDDPQFHRLQALGCEDAHELDRAHKHWQQYEAELATLPAGFAPEHLPLARALVWNRMGSNAAAVPDKATLDHLPPMLRNHPARPQPLKPGAEECFRKSLALYPKLLETHEALFHHLAATQKAAKAESAGRALLKQFPGHAATLENLGTLCLEHGKCADGLELLQRALQANPLDRELRGKVGHAQMLCARLHAQAARFDDARRHYQDALDLEEGPDRASIQYRWAGCEFLAGDIARAEELLQSARESAGSSLAVAFGMLTEIARLKLPKPLKDRFSAEVTAGLAGPPDPPALTAMVELLAQLQGAAVEYHGQKSHTKKVLDYLKKSLDANFSEKQLMTISKALVELHSKRLARDYARLGRQRFPREPLFPLTEALTHLTDDPFRTPSWNILPLFEEAERLTLALPPEDSRRSRLLQDIQERLTFLRSLSPMGFLEGLMGEDYFDDDDDDDFDDSF